MRAGLTGGYWLPSREGQEVGLRPGSLSPDCRSRGRGGKFPRPRWVGVQITCEAPENASVSLTLQLLVGGVEVAAAGWILKMLWLLVLHGSSPTLQAGVSEDNSVCVFEGQVGSGVSAMKRSCFPRILQVLALHEHFVSKLVDCQDNQFWVVSWNRSVYLTVFTEWALQGAQTE